MLINSSIDYLFEESKDKVLVREARSWAENCRWIEDPEGMSDYLIVRGVNRHYFGGWEQFKKDCPI